MKKLLYILLTAVILFAFAACSGDGQDTAEAQERQTPPPIQDEVPSDAVDDYVIDDDYKIEEGPPEDYFPRIDFDAIDFNSLIISTDTPHGYIGHWYVRHISTELPSRVAFTYRELDAALWLVQMLHAKGFNEEQVRLQTFSRYDIIPWEDYFGWGLPGLYAVRRQGWTGGHQERGYSQNVIVTIPGQSPQTIIIGAHYDSLRYPGTSDNASGTALLMENAQRMLAKDNYYTLVYVFFGAHEIGMFGGFYFYNSLSAQEREVIMLYIQADVLIEGPDLVFSTGHGFELNPNALSEEMTARIEAFSDAHEIRIRPMPVTGSEQLLFLYKGYTTLAFWGIDPARFTNFLHTERDCYQYISIMFPGMIETNMGAFALLLEEVLQYR